MEQVQNNTVRVHRVGSITAGMSMVIWGVMFALCELRIVQDILFVIKLWPLVLIGLGIEILWFNVSDKKLVYDKGAVLLLMIMTGFSVMMAAADIFTSFYLTYLK